MADYSNRLNVISSIVTPPTKTITIYPIKDAYVDQSRPVEPFDIKTLLVNSSTTEDQSTTKTIMYFKVPHVTNSQFDNIVSVNLNLKGTSRFGRDVNFQLRYNAHFGWPESGTTWLSCPQDRNLISTLKKGPNDRNLEFDITSIFKSHKNEDFDFPITIMEDPNDGTADSVAFGSKEGTITYKPTITITYTYFPDNMDYINLKGQLTIRRNVPNDDEPAADLKGKVNIFLGLTNTEVPGQINIKTETGSTEVPGVLNVRRYGWHYQNAQLKVRRTVPGEYDPAPDLEGQIDINLYKADSQEHTPADSRYVQHKPSADLNGKVETHTYTGDPSELQGQLNVRIVIPNAAYPAPDLKGQLTIREYIADDDTAKDTNDEKHTPSSNLNGQLNIKVNIPNDAYPTPDLPGQLNINLNNTKDELPGQLTVRRTIPNDDEPAPDLNGQLNINIYNANTDLSGTLYIKPKHEIDGKVSIKFYTDEKDLPGQINVIGRGNDELKGKLIIKAFKDLKGQMFVRPRKSTDLVGVLTIGEGENMPYAFIM